MIYSIYAIWRVCAALCSRTSRNPIVVCIFNPSFGFSFFFSVLRFLSLTLFLVFAVHVSCARFYYLHTLISIGLSVFTYDDDDGSGVSSHTEIRDRKGEKLNGFSIYTLKEFKFSSDLNFFCCCRRRRRRCRQRLVEFRYEPNNANIFLNRRTGLARHQWQRERISYRVLWFVNETDSFSALFSGRCVCAFALSSSPFILSGALRWFIIWYCALAATPANKTRETKRCASRINTQIVEWIRSLYFKFEEERIYR